MKIKKINYTPYKKSLKKSFYNSQNKYSYTEGVIIELIISHSSKSIIGYGEASILAGFSSDNIQKINWGIESFIAGIEFGYDYSLDELLNLAEIQCHDLPSLHFAIDTALYDLTGKIQQLPLSTLLNIQSATSVEFSELYMPYNKPNFNQNLIMKYKLGVNEISDDIKILNDLVKNNQSIHFRFDANQLYTETEFFEVVKKLQHFNIDYFEEPIINLSSAVLKRINNTLTINIAIDESLYNGKNYLKWIENNWIHSVIIKPSIFGGYKKNFKLYKQCKAQNINIILSSSLEDSIGNMATIHLAASINNKLTHGLNIHNFYDKFVYTPVYLKNASSVNVDKLIGLGI